MPAGQQVGKERSDDVEGQVENRQHDAEEDGQGQVFAGDDPVDGFAALPLPGLPALDHCAGTDLLNEVIAHIRQSGVAVHAAFRLHLLNAVLDQLFFVLVQLQPLIDVGVAFDELRGGKAHRDVRLLGVILDLVDHRMDATVDRTGRAEVVHGGVDLVFGDCHGDPHQFLYAFVLDCGDGYHGDAQRLGHGLDVDGSAVGGDLIHHVQGQHHGDAHLHELQRQVEVPLDVGGVDNVDEAVGLLVQNEIPGDDLLRRVGADGVNARQVHHRAVFLAPDGAGFLVHGDAGKVAHVLIGAGELVEEGGLAAVLVAGQRENHDSATST